MSRSSRCSTRTDGRLLSPDRAFTFGDVQYPANWLRLSTQEDRDAIGIVWVEPDPVWDQRFYWGYDADGQLIPKDHAQLVEQWVTQTKTTAGTLLAPTDWMITRSAEPGGKPASDEVLAQRAAIRAKSDEKEAALLATTSTEELASYVTSSDYTNWSNDPNTATSDPAADGLLPTGNGSEVTAIFDSGTSAAGLDFS